MSENNTQTPAQEKPRRSKEDILEIIIAVFLGVTALATAWASWIGSLHGGNMSTNYTKSNNLAADGTPAGTRLPRRSCRICRCGT